MPEKWSELVQNHILTVNEARQGAQQDFKTHVETATRIDAHQKALEMLSRHKDEPVGESDKEDDVEYVDVFTGDGQHIRRIKAAPSHGIGYIDTVFPKPAAIMYEKALDEFEGRKSRPDEHKPDYVVEDTTTTSPKEYEFYTTRDDIDAKWYDGELIGMCSECRMDDLPIVDGYRDPTKPSRCRNCYELWAIGVHLREWEASKRYKKSSPSTFPVMLWATLLIMYVTAVILIFLGTFVPAGMLSLCGVVIAIFMINNDFG